MRVTHDIDERRTNQLCYASQTLFSRTLHGRPRLSSTGTGNRYSTIMIGLQLPTSTCRRMQVVPGIWCILPGLLEARHVVSQPAAAVNRIQGAVRHHGSVPHKGI